MAGDQRYGVGERVGNDELVVGQIEFAGGVGGGGGRGAQDRWRQGEARSRDLRVGGDAHVEGAELARLRDGGGVAGEVAGAVVVDDRVGRQRAGGVERRAGGNIDVGAGQRTAGSDRERAGV